jgi:hypothetical protein
MDELQRSCSSRSRFGGGQGEHAVNPPSCKENGEANLGRTMTNGDALAAATLAEFLRSARQNEELAGRALPDYVDHLEKIYSVFRRITGHLDHPEVILLPFLATRSFAAFLAGCRLELSGMPPRSCALRDRPSTTPSMGFGCTRTSWIARQVASKEATHLRKFGFGGTNLELASTGDRRFSTFEHHRTANRDQLELGTRAKNLYDQTISASGHPNPEGVAGSLTFVDQERALSTCLTS